MRLPVLAFTVLLLTGLPNEFSQASDDLSQLNHDYIDDDDQRRLADLQFSVAEKTGALWIRIAATGPGVEPIGGYRGIHGSNRYTAEELDLILRGLHKAQVVTEDEDGNRMEGRIFANEFDALLERRLLPNGSIDFLHRTRGLPLQIDVDAQADSDRTLRTVVVIDGQTRLTCRYRIQDGRIVDLEVQSRGHDGYLAQQSPVAGRNRLWKMAFRQEVESPVSEEEWKRRDSEGRWVLMSNQIARSPQVISQWVTWLAQTQQFELLEWLAIYQLDAFKSAGVGRALLEADAPQWVRVAAWHRNTSPYLGHSKQQATQMLLEASPGPVEHWLKTHQESLDNWEPALVQLYSQLQQDDIQAEDSNRYLPPLQPAEIFKPLSANKVTAFGDRLRAEEGVVYTHQVTRAINAVVISGRRSQKVTQQIRKLIRHGQDQIRIEALLAHSFLLPGTEAEPVTDFLAIVDDREETPEVREAALLGVSYQDHPSVILRLHQIAAVPGHPAWKAAVSRIGDLNRPFSVEILTSLADDALKQDQQKVMENSLMRLQNNAGRNATAPFNMAKLLMLASVAQAESDPHAALIKKWLRATCSNAAQENLDRLKQEYSVEKLSQVYSIWEPPTGSAWQLIYRDLLAEVTQ